MKKLLMLLPALVVFTGCNMMPLDDGALADRAAELLAGFEALDLNMDGVLDTDELVGSEELSMTVFWQLDTDGDEAVTREELGEAEADPDPALAGAWRGQPGSDTIGGFNVASARFEGTRLRWGRTPVADPDDPSDVLTIDLLGRFSVDGAASPAQIDVTFDGFDLMRELNTAALNDLFAGRPQADVDAFLEATDTTDLSTAIRVYLNGLEGQFNVLIAQIGGKVLPGLYAVEGDALQIAVSGTPGGERPTSLEGGAQLTRVR